LRELLDHYGHLGTLAAKSLPSAAHLRRDGSSCRELPVCVVAGGVGQPCHERPVP
jgi:hypothetical protein